MLDAHCSFLHEPMMHQFSGMLINTNSSFRGPPVAVLRNRAWHRCSVWPRERIGLQRLRGDGKGVGRFVGCGRGEEVVTDGEDVDADLQKMIELLEEEGVPMELEYGIEEFEKYNTNVYFEDGLDDGALEEGGPDHKSGYVALIGLPNVGKSTLLNSIVGQKLAIVTKKAQTTRHRIRGLVSGENFQMVFFDTPGIITRYKTKLDEKMMKSVRQAVNDSDAVLMLVDSTDDPKADIEMIQPPKDWSGPPMAVVLNKVDLVSPGERQELCDW